MEPTKLKMNAKEMAKTLAEQAEKSKTFKAMAELFASRQRTRQTIVVTSLVASMKKAGHAFTIPDYREELRFLSNLGLGIPVYGRNSEIKALKSIRVKLQSIGSAALKASQSLKAAKQAPTFINLPVPTPPAPKPYVPHSRTFNKASLTVTIEGTTFMFEFTPRVPIQQVFNLIAELTGETGEVLKWTAMTQKE